MTGTDLPVPQCGTGGSINDRCDQCPLDLLEVALTAVPAPPLDDTTRAAAYRWLAQVQAGMVFRREARILARALERAITEERHSRRHLEAISQSMRRRQADRAEIEAGTYWARREAGRVSQRPVRVEVDPEAWQRFKTKSAAAGTTVGELLGAIAAEVVESPPPPPDDGSERRTVFLRIAITDEAWARFAHNSRVGTGTVARRLGALVERYAT